jgi:hypothetical protein
MRHEQEADFLVPCRLFLVAIMIQNQLVDYISSQLKLGVSRDSVKTALVGVGWAAQDVEDTFKKVEQPATSVQQPAQQSAVSPAAAAKSPDIRVSDLVSASLTPTVLLSSHDTAPKVSPTMMRDKMSAAPAVGQPMKRMGKSAFVMIGLILVLAGVSAYLYFQNSSLSSQVQTLGGQSQGSVSQVSSLNDQVQALNVSNTSLTAQIAQLSTQVQELQTELSFFMVPVGQSATVPVAATVAGVLSGGKPTYIVTTAEGVKVSVKNSADADVKAALQPLLGVAGTVQISGTHNPGSPSVTVSDVNGAPVTKPAAVATSTPAASSTPAATSSGQ